jgi:hypothetical protein
MSKMMHAVEAVIAKAIERAHSTKGEIKNLTVTPIGKDLFIQIETGMKGDEGTMAEILCRTYGTFTVTLRGTIRAEYCRRGSRSKAQQYPLIYGFSSTMGDQVRVWGTF